MDLEVWLKVGKWQNKQKIEKNLKQLKIAP